MTKAETQKRAARFNTTRKQHSIETAEDYTELIAELIVRDGTARIGTIAEQLGVSHVTTLRTVRRLEKEGYVKAPHHRPVELTKLGATVAKAAKMKHEMLVAFLIKARRPGLHR